MNIILKPNAIIVIFVPVMKKLKFILFLLFFCSAVSCSLNPSDKIAAGCLYARYFETVTVDSVPCLISISPYDGARDTVKVDEPFDKIICMSTSHVACMSAIGADSLISAVSGLRYIADQDIHNLGIPDIGYDSLLDYEKIMSLSPDILVAYTVSDTEPPYLAKIRSLGIPVVVLHDHLENHPLARAEYLRCFGVLTGLQDEADSVFQAVVQKYESVISGHDETVSPVKVLVNIPYGDAWYIPGEESYFSQLIRDAGGEIIGAEKGMSSSSVISMEEAWFMSRQADVWLNPGLCRNRQELKDSHPLFSSFGPVEHELPIYNNTLRTTPEGGNDFYESGAVRPDLIVEDLVCIFSDIRNAGNDVSDKELNYFLPLL